MRAMEILKKCKNKIDNMTKSQFIMAMKIKELDKKTYDASKYIDGCFRIKYPNNFNTSVWEKSNAEFKWDFSSNTTKVNIISNNTEVKSATDWSPLAA
ncbi:hypothetical protein [Clostridium paraputrificum]|uniref:hypothetical protein n=1 Tax=Clostridium paraputrificum TaxID=29363 RepID=UPI000401FD96|nr:hypothetical protein [Clostridium paraputrificum]